MDDRDDRSDCATPGGWRYRCTGMWGVKSSHGTDHAGHNGYVGAAPRAGMGFHTFDADRAASLEDPGRYRYCSREELVALLDPSPADTVADLGSGTGFYTADIAPHVRRCYAVDVQSAMGRHHRDGGVTAGVEVLTADVGTLPLPADHLDGAVSTMTFHEVAGPGPLREVRRVLAPAARLAVVDWSAAGPGEAGPPTDERHDAAAADELLSEAGFTVERAAERVETFVVTALA